MSKQGELGTSHTEKHTSQWTGSVIQVTRMGLGFGANCGVPERLGAGWQSSPGASGNRAEPPTTEQGSSKSPGISHARVGIRCSLPVAAGAGSQQISRQQLCHLQIPRQAHAHMCHIPPGPSGETQQPMLAPQFENLKLAGSTWLTAGASPPPRLTASVWPFWSTEPQPPKAGIQLVFPESSALPEQKAIGTNE